VNPPRSATCKGILDADVADVDRALVKNSSAACDLQNRPVLESGGIGFGGTLVIDHGGDYAFMSGADLVKKLIHRRLVSRPGDFFHLPGYGIGLREKEPISPGELVRLKRNIETQISKEPEVDQCLATLTLSSDGYLIVQLKVKLRPMGELELTYPAGAQSVSL
jgi:hypothetical protein